MNSKSKAPSLAAAMSGHDRRSQGGTAPAVEKAPARSRPRSRTDKRAVTCYVSSEAHKQLRLLAVETGTSVLALLCQGLNAVFENAGKPPIA